MRFRDSSEWRLGRWGENEVRSWFERCGWFVVPTNCIEDGGAPMLTGLLEARVLPDLQVARAGSMRWVEVKTKTRACYYQKASQWRHGIGLRVWLDYVAVEHKTGQEGHLAIIQLRPERMLLLATFAALSIDAQKYHGDAMPNGERMAWFNVDRFERLDMDTECPEPAPSHGMPPPRPPTTPPPAIEPTTVRPWERGRQMGPKQELMPW